MIWRPCSWGAFSLVFGKGVLAFRRRVLAFARIAPAPAHIPCALTGASLALAQSVFVRRRDHQALAPYSHASARTRPAFAYPSLVLCPNELPTWLHRNGVAPTRFIIARHSLAIQRTNCFRSTL